MNHPTRPEALRVEITPKTLLVVLGALAGAWVMWQLAPVFLVIVMALVLAGTLSLSVEMLEKRRVGRGMAITVVFGGLVLTTLLVALLTVPAIIKEVIAVAGDMPSLRDRLVALTSRSSLTLPIAEWLRELHYGAFAKNSLTPAIAYSRQILTGAAYIGSTVFLALYMLIDRDRLRGGLFALVPRTHHIRLSRVVLNLETIVGGYIRGQIITSAMMTVYTFALLAACQVPNALAIAVVAGIADVLPYVGPALSLGPALLSALSRGPTVTVIVLVGLLVYAQIESRIIVPRVYGRALRLPSSIVLVALLAGATVMGIVGALLALPLAAAIRMLIEELRVELPGEAAQDELVLAIDARDESEYEMRTEGVPVEEAAAIAVEITERTADALETVSTEALAESKHP